MIFHHIFTGSPPTQRGDYPRNVHQKNIGGHLRIPPSTVTVSRMNLAKSNCPSIKYKSR